MTNRKRLIETSEAPAAIGPYSQAIAAGGFVYTSGQIPLDPRSGAIVGQSAAEQAEQVMMNLQAVLAAAGVGFAEVVKAQIFLLDMNDFSAVNEVYARWLGGALHPARSTVQVARLPRDVRVEIEMIAYSGD